MSVDSQNSTIQTKSGLRTEERVCLVYRKNAEFDDLSCEEDDKGVGQVKLKDSLKVEEKEANDWEKKLRGGE